MPSFNANLTLLFQEHDFLDRFDAAAAAGFKAVEYQFPYDFSKDAVAARLKDSGLELVLHNLPAGDWAEGDRGIACQPSRTREFRAGVERALDYAAAVGAPRLNCLAGLPDDGVAAEKTHATFVENLQFAAPKLKDAGIQLMIEAVNTIDVPGFFLKTTAQAAAILDDVGSDNLFIQYDAYHMQIMEGDLCRTVETYLDRIGHIQIADNPGRHEPGTGEINYPNFFKHLDAIGYEGWVSGEYIPATSTVEGLGWFRDVS